jgi:biopolymer transport protein ExbB/TolQ
MIKCASNKITLKEYFLLKFGSLDKALELQAKEYERRLDNLNHEAQQLKDMQSTYVPREAYEIKQGQIEQELKDLRRAKDITEGKASQRSVNIAYLIASLSFIIGLIGLVLDLLRR